MGLQPRSEPVIAKGLVKGKGRYRRTMAAFPPEDHAWIRDRAVAMGRPWSDALRDIIAEARAREALG